MSSGSATAKATVMMAVVVGIASSMWVRFRKPALEAQLEEETGVLQLSAPLHNWIPNAIENWGDVVRRLDSKMLAIFLDYDGTLSPIVNNPSEALLSESVRDDLRRLATRHRTAIVTGRNLDTIKAFVKIEEIHYAASHGFDICGPNGAPMKQVGEEFLPDLARAFELLVGKLGHVRGCLIENNRFSLSIHYRNVEEARNRVLIEKVVDEAVAMSGAHLVRTDGKMVWEIRPKQEWNKGTAVDYLLENLFHVSNDVVPIYIGDDKTDEDAFVAVKARGGIAIIVSSDSRPTAATFAVKSPAQVFEVIRRLIDLPSSLST